MKNGYITNQKVTLVIGEFDGTKIFCFDDPVKMVCELIHSGYLNGYHSTRVHIAALEIIKGHLEQALADAIAEDAEQHRAERTAGVIGWDPCDVHGKDER